MRHRTLGRQLSRDTEHRKALRRNLATALLSHGAIRTTEPKAKELRRYVEKLITTAKKGTLHARRQVMSELGNHTMFNDDGDPLDQTVVQKLFSEIAPRFANRPGGYTRLIRLAERRIGDAGKQVLIQLVEDAPKADENAPSGRSRRRKGAAAADDAGEKKAE